MLKPTSAWTRAVEDGWLIDVTDWTSADGGMFDGFRLPVVMTRALWDQIHTPPKLIQHAQRAVHDVLWATRQVLHDGRKAWFWVELGGRNVHLHAVVDDAGITIGLSNW